MGVHYHIHRLEGSPRRHAVAARCRIGHSDHYFFGILTCYADWSAFYRWIEHTEAKAQAVLFMLP